MHSSDGIFVAVVDRERADRVVWKSIPEGAGYMPAQYEAIAEHFEGGGMATQAAVLNYAAYQASGAETALSELPEWAQSDSDTVSAIWTLLDAQTDRDDFELAAWTLANNGHEGARRVAACVLANFLDRDLAWWTLMDAVRDPVERVRGQATMCLSSALKHKSRKVDWRPMAPSLSHLLNGTNVSATSTVARVLVGTEVDPDLARDLLGSGAHTLIDYVGASTKFAHESARKLLEHLTGEKHGHDAEAWVSTVTALKVDSTTK